MALTIRELPSGERPRERLRTHGAQALSSSELIAILLGSGSEGRSALGIGQEILSTCRGSLRLLASQSGTSSWTVLASSSLDLICTRAIEHSLPKLDYTAICRMSVILAIARYPRPSPHLLVHSAHGLRSRAAQLSANPHHDCRCCVDGVAVSTDHMHGSASWASLAIAYTLPDVK